MFGHFKLYLQYYLGSVTDCLVNQLQILNNTINVLCHAYS